MTDKQKKFCEEYLTGLNATQAAIHAGYSEKTAGSIGNENLKKPEIKKYIAELQAEGQERNQIKRDDILGELKKIGFADIDLECISAKDKIKALDTLAHMLGFVTAEKYSGEVIRIVDDI